MSGIRYEEIEGVFHIEGVINEKCDFIEFFTGKPNQVTLNLGKVRRINSTGVRRWTEALAARPELNITLESCPREIVDQCNMIPEFMGHKQVEVRSFFAHYYCEECDEEKATLLKVDEHYRPGEGVFNEPDMTCGKENCEMELDDNPKKYYRFLGAY